MAFVDEIKKAEAEGTLVVGTKETMKAIRNGKAARVFLAKNCPDAVRKDVEHYAKLSGFSVESVEYSNEDIGMVCKKPYSISVVCVLKI